MNKQTSEKSKTALAGLQVDVIPAKARYVKTGQQLKNIRVAAYCRVSTGDESQQTSYTAQKHFYTDLINRKSGWKMAGVYADEARSGTSREHRAQFNQMIEDALEGKMDYIITKSISRFARNTVDTLDCVRKLQRLSPPIGIYFEKENIDTLNSNSEMFLTLYSSIAQEESRSISENIRWSFQKNFREGKPVVNLQCMIGYDKAADGTWVINEKQADIVRFIFHRFVHGDTGRAIARQLNDMGKKTVKGSVWRSDAIYYILRNEKYIGDLEMQKTVTESFLTHKSVPNRGQAPKYYVSGHHAPIIDRVTWQKAQALLGRPDPKSKIDEAALPKQRKRGRQKSVFSILTCGCCGRPMRRMTYHVTIPAAEIPDSEQELNHFFSDPVWKCLGERKTGKKKAHSKKEKHQEHGEQDGFCCSRNRLRELAMEQSFMELLYRLKRDRDKNGEESRLNQMFQRVYQEKKKEELPQGYAIQRVELLDMQIKDLEERDQTEYVLRKLEVIREEKLQIQRGQGASEILKKNFQTFLKLLDGLPSANSAGQPISIASLDEGAPDVLEFDKAFFSAVITAAFAWGDVVHYETNFGVRLTTDGNCRTPDALIGFRICPSKGVSYIAENRCQVYRNKLTHSKKK